MAEGEGAKERPQRRGRPNPGEQPAHRAVPQQAHVVDRVGPGDHARDQRQDLQDRVAATGLVDPDVLGDQVLQACPFGKLQHRRQSCARHEVGVIERGSNTVADSHPADALL